MATALTVQTIRGHYQGSSGAGSLHITFAAADVAGNTFVCTGKEILLIQGGAAPYTVTLTSTDDPFGRTEDIAAYSITTTEFAAYGPIPRTGWASAAGLVTVTASNAAVKFAVIRYVD
jgi:hypothetical protein